MVLYIIIITLVVVVVVNSNNNYARMLNSTKYNTMAAKKSVGFCRVLVSAPLLT